MRGDFVMVYLYPDGSHRLGQIHLSRNSAYIGAAQATLNGLRPLYLLHIKRVK